MATRECVEVKGSLAGGPFTVLFVTSTSDAAPEPLRIARVALVQAATLLRSHYFGGA